jgi:hypothetical protein
MWWAILFLINLNTGEHVFSLYRLPFESKDMCLASISRLAAPYDKAFVAKAGCVEFPYTSEEL